MAWTGKRPSAFADTITDAVSRKTRAAAMQALAGVIERSPVGNPDNWRSVKEWQRRTGNSGRPPWLSGYIGGTFRGNNRVSVGSPDRGFDVDDQDSTGAAALSAGSAVIASTRGAPFTVIYVQNNLPYARVLEDGSSQQAPQGVFAVTFNSLVEASR